MQKTELKSAEKESKNTLMSERIKQAFRRQYPDDKISNQDLKEYINKILKNE